MYLFLVYLGDNNQCPLFRRSLSKSFLSLDKGINSTFQAQKQDLGPNPGHTLYSWKVYTLRGSFSENEPRCPCNVLSCLEKAVWTFSQLTSDESIMYSSPAAASLPARHPARALAEMPLPGAGSVHDQLGSRSARGQLREPAEWALPDRW